ncbi:MAG: LPXTG cell wall anchor domain-containing protein [Ilumatobacteraceae bacterium]
MPAGNTGSTMWKIGSTSFTGTPSSAAGMDNGPVSSTGNGTITLGTQRLPGTTTVGPWVYAYTTWTPDDYGYGSDGRVDSFPGDCKAPQPDAKVEYGEWSNGTFECGDTSVTQTRTKTVTGYVWSGGKWVLDSQNAVTSTETQSRQPTSEEIKACTPQPDAKVEYGEWSNGTFECGDESVIQTRTVTTTEYVWDDSEWVLDSQNAVTSTETQSRQPTSEEIKACTPQPDVKTTYTEWSNGTFECGDTEVTQTRTKTVTEYVWDADQLKWVLDSENAVTSTEKQTRQPTEDELKSCEAETTVTTPETTVTDPTTTTLVSPDSGVVDPSTTLVSPDSGSVPADVTLPETGAAGTGIQLAAALAALGAGTALVVVARRRRQAPTDV